MRSMKKKDNLKDNLRGYSAKPVKTIQPKKKKKKAVSQRAGRPMSMTALPKQKLLR